MLCNDADQEDPETSPDWAMASSRFTPFHKNRYGIPERHNLSFSWIVKMWPKGKIIYKKVTIQRFYRKWADAIHPRKCIANCGDRLAACSDSISRKQRLQGDE
jgi:hypothetical protein